MKIYVFRLHYKNYLKYNEHIIRGWSNTHSCFLLDMIADNTAYLLHPSSIMKINIKADIEKLSKKLNATQKKQIPFAAANAINQTAFQTRKQIQKDMDTIFRNGAAPFTKRGVLVKKANKKFLEGNVYINKEQSKYLEKQVFGGVRREGFFIPIPFRDRVSLSKQGNLTKAKLRALIANKKNKVLNINNVRGVYDVSKDKPRLLVAMQQKTTKYDNPKFDFFSLGRRIIKKNFQKNYRLKLKQALQTAR